MIVKKVIIKNVTNCKSCPYFSFEHDMNATFCVCELMKDRYGCFIPDINWIDCSEKISKNCPYKSEDEK